jgi:hypothetical protein
MKTNWKNKLKTVLGKAEFSEVSTNSALTKTDKSHLSLVSSAFVSGKLVDTSEKLTDSPELNKQSTLVSSAFVSGKLVDTFKKNDELANFKSEKLHEILNRFIFAGVSFDVSTDDFQIVDNAGILKTSDREFLELNYSIILCTLQQSLLMKHLFNHSPEQFEDFAFEIREREAIFSEDCLNSQVTKGDKTRFEIYFRAVESVTRKWFDELLKEKDKARTSL